ncbi:MAG: hypothetical protein PHS57_10700 [Alphaproteobacteria bacterium]|nr:hypothetical protein [Alphaproteobacteria bacterium]
MLILLGKNAVPRPDMDAAIGANFDMTSDHITEGKLTVKIPADATPPRECDRIYITEIADDAPVYAATQSDVLNGTWDSFVGKLLNGEMGIPPSRSYLYNTDVICGASGFDTTQDIQTVLSVGDEIRFPTVIFSGMIMGVEQQDVGLDPDTSYKIYDLTLASSARILSRVYCNIKYPKGASVTQILYGNQPAYPWYSAALRAFPGLLDIRLEAEGFYCPDFNKDYYDTASPDRFDEVALDSAANLWGLTVAEVLDTLAMNAGASWEIDSFDAFTFRALRGTGATTPFPLDTTAPVFDLKPTRDNYTTYSAVRLVGGTGPSAPVSVLCLSTQRDEFKTNALEIVDSTHGVLQFPLDKYYQISDNPSDPYNRHYCMYFQASASAPTAAYYPVFYDGIETVPSGVRAAVVTSGSANVTLVNGLTWPALPSTPSDASWRVAFRYSPLVPIVARLVDPVLQSEVQAQAGGTGIVEYVYKDEAITDFTQAASTATNLLSSVSKRTVAVEFSTFTPGFSVGQSLTGDLPYYGVSGEYAVTEVKTILERADDDARAVWRYEITASTAAYRDAVKGLFYTPTVSQFKLGEDFPAADGMLIQSGVGFQGTVWAYVCDPWTWTQLDAENRSWNDIAALNWMWDDWLNPTTKVNHGSNDGFRSRLTDEGAGVLANMLRGGAPPVNGEFDLSHRIQLVSDDGGAAEIHQKTGTDPARYDSNAVLSQYTFIPGAGYLWKTCQVQNAQGTTVAEIPVNIDTRPGGDFAGHSAVIYIMWIPYSSVTGIGGHITDWLARALALAVQNPAFGIQNALYGGYFIDQYAMSGDNLDDYDTRIYDVTRLLLLHNKDGTCTSWIYPVGPATLQGRNLITVFYVPPEECYEFATAHAGNPYMQGPIPFKIDKSTNSPIGDFTLTIVKKDVVL